MNADAKPQPDGQWRRSAAFLSDFRAFAGASAAAVMALIAVGALLEGVGLVLLVPILAAAMDSTPDGGWLGSAAATLLSYVPAGTRLAKLALLIGAFAFLMIVRAVVIAARDERLARLEIGFVDHLRLRLMGALTNARWEAIARLNHARITHLLGGEIQRAANSAHYVLQGAVSAVVLLVQWALALALSPLLALMAMAVIAIGAVMVAPALRRARELGQALTETDQSLMNVTLQFLGGLKLAISHNREAAFLSEFQRAQGDLSGRILAYLRERSRSRVAVSTVFSLLAAGIVLVGFGVLDVAPAILITLLLILARMTGPMTEIQQGVQQFIHGLPAYDGIRRMETELTGAQTRPTPHAVSIIPEGPILLRNVSYRYRGAGADHGGLKSADLEIVPGTILGVTGPSGAGKSTFADLLTGLISPETGHISIGGLALSPATVSAWRDRVSYVSQDPFLFHDTVRRNFLWSNPDASEEEMWRALAIAGAERFVRSLPDGLDTMAGERGTLMSGGERQRLALARAILRKPRLLVLDEATNAIDIASEQEILARLGQLRPRPVIIMIAHRAESLSATDRVVVLEKGVFSASAGALWSQREGAALP